MRTRVGFLTTKKRTIGRSFGQYVEIPREIAFTIECSVRSAWEAIRVLLKRGPAPPPVCQGQYDPKALLSALQVFVG
jgi:oleate hydratase